MCCRTIIVLRLSAYLNHIQVEVELFVVIIGFNEVNSLVIGQ